MNSKTNAITKQFTMALALVGCISIGFAQNNNVISTAKTSQKNVVSANVDRTSLSPIEEKNTKAKETTVFAYLNNSEDHSFLVRVIKLVGLEETLQGKGPFTVFAPNNAAFNALPEETLETLFDAENREALKEILSYHVMPGNQGVNELTRAVNGNGGEARLKTLSGTTLTATLQGDKIVLVGANGAKSTIISGDKTQTNGMVHTINAVAMPN
ncbi:MAG: fasciclin domain-containing protein [Bizionia sp.]|nr:fasciclin domain-containing protein [Bizionia sp.]